MRVVTSWVLVGALGAGCSMDRTPIGSPRDGAGSDELVAGAEGAAGASSETSTEGVLESLEREQAEEPSEPKRADLSPAVGSDGFPVDDPEPVAIEIVEEPSLDQGSASEPIQRFAGPCSSDADCHSDEICLSGPGLLGRVSYCSQQCANDADCDTIAGASLDPVCNGDGNCRLPCDFVVNDCADPMICQDALFIVPAGTGTCSYRQ